MLTRVLSSFLLFYRKFISPHHPHVCRFTPTCSRYALDGLECDGVRALPWIAWRVLRCNPFSHGGFDPYVAKSPKCDRRIV